MLGVRVKRYLKRRYCQCGDTPAEHVIGENGPICVGSACAGKALSERQHSYVNDPNRTSHK